MSKLKNKVQTDAGIQMRVFLDKTFELSHSKNLRTFWKIYLLGAQFPNPSKHDYNLGNTSIQE